ncbi:translocation/assembly module TamB domain-containing protein [Microvirga lenta]|uniref:translocation/assembly module TamB domain-containing protein n=1 Tax=Microvirga lenta TaxID=2881337 RepID=UPI001CFE7E84|nr:translocation/assembly module TamB domain-containing protein [Microvirga lenta]MCB5174234.1 translocation/assembly module TamB domain-containing protein [Microvirga lenta]
MTSMRRFMIPLILLLAGAILFTLTLGTRSDEADRGFLAGLISRALSTPSTQVSIGAVEGALSSDATIRDITISDREGVWFRLDRARIVWRRLALLSRRLEIDTLDIGQVQILRRPIPADETVAGADEPLLPELPVKVQIEDFSLQELTLGQPILGVAARLTASGEASLGNPAEGLNLRFDARRLDAPGTFVARLTYASERLDLNFSLNEPEGGILARAANIPGLPPVQLDLTGQGPLDDFAAQLTFNAGDTIGAVGSANLRRQGDVRRLGLDLNARIEGLLPDVIAPVFAGNTELDANATFADNGAVNISQLSIVSRTARLDATGSLSADQNVDLRLSARAVPTDQGRTVAGGAEIRTLVFDGTVSGPLTSPRIAGDLQAEDVQVPAGRMEELTASFSATPNGLLSEPSTRIALVADARARGVALADPSLARAVGNELTLTFRGSAAPDGATDIETARLSTPSMEASYSGRLGTQDAVGRLTVQAPDLSRFGELASLRLRGELDLSAQVEGLLSDGPTLATIDGNASRFATGIDAIDRLAGGRLALSGGVRLLPNGGVTFQNLRLVGAHASARLDGEATPNALALDADINLPDLRRADPRLTGRGEIVAKLSGTLDRPNATLRANLSDATALGRPISNLTLDATANDLLGLLDARVNLSGEVDRKPANGTVHVAKRNEGGWLLDELNLNVGSVAVSGNAALDATNLATGRLRIDARDLNDLSPLVLTPLTGDLNADVTLEVVDGRQNAQLEAQGARLRLADISIERLNARASIADLYTRPVVDAAIAIDRAVVAGETFSRIRLDAAGTPAASEITLTAEARGFSLDARGRLVPETPIRFDLTAFTARRDRRQIALAQPTTITFADDGVAVRELVLGVDRGRISVDGRAGSTLDLRLAAQSVPLSAVDIFVPGTGLSGTLDGTAQIGGTASAPTGEWRLRLTRLVAAQARDLGAPPLDISAQGRLTGGATTVEGTINAGRAGTLRVTGTVPLGTGVLDLSAQGRVDLSIANSFLSATGRQVTGNAALDLRIGGTLSEPAVNGTLTLSGGSFRDLLQGIRLDNIQGRFVARGTDISIERFSATTRNGGTLSASGRVALDPEAGFPGDIRVTGRRAELVSNEIVTTTANLDLTLSGPLAQNPRISGQVLILSMDVTVPERLPATIRPIEGTRHVNPPPIVAARLAQKARVEAGTRQSSVFNAILDLTVVAPSRIFVRGRGIDAELGGDLQLTGTLDNPVAIGAFNLRRGRLSVVGTRLDFTRGRLTFTGDLTPELDFLAETRAGDVTARIGVTGSAREPQFTFTSDPDLPQDEVLSRLLFAKASGGLSATQALQLAQVAAQFSGSGGDGVFESLRRSLGVEGLDISLGAEGGPTIGISRAISDRISVGVKAGASTEQSGISVDIDVTRRIRVQGEVGASGNTAVGVGAEWEY